MSASAAERVRELLGHPMWFGAADDEVAEHLRVRPDVVSRVRKQRAKELWSDEMTAQARAMASDFGYESVADLVRDSLAAFKPERATENFEQKMIRFATESASEGASEAAEDSEATLGAEDAIAALSGANTARQRQVLATAIKALRRVRDFRAAHQAQTGEGDLRSSLGPEIAAYRETAAGLEHGTDAGR